MTEHIIPQAPETRQAPSGDRVRYDRGQWISGPGISEATMTSCPAWCELEGDDQHADQDGRHVARRSTDRFDLELSQAPGGTPRVSIADSVSGRELVVTDAADAGGLAGALAELAASTW
jgi:hypothetical protein